MTNALGAAATGSEYPHLASCRFSAIQVQSVAVSAHTCFRRWTCPNRKEAHGSVFRQDCGLHRLHLDADKAVCLRQNSWRSNRKPLTVQRISMVCRVNGERGATSRRSNPQSSELCPACNTSGRRPFTTVLARDWPLTTT